MKLALEAHDEVLSRTVRSQCWIPPAKPGGNKRTVNLREIANGLMYILSTGCQWRDPERLAATLDPARLFRSVELGRHARKIPFPRNGDFGSCMGEPQSPL